MADPSFIEFEKDIQQFIGGKEQRYVISGLLTHRQRQHIHNLCEKYKLTSITNDTTEKLMMKTIVITKGERKQITKTDAKITEDMIYFFAENMKVPITVFDPELVDYYIDAFDRFYRCKNNFKAFIHDIQKYGGLSKLRGLMGELRTQIVGQIKNHPHYIKMMEQLSIKTSDIPNSLPEYLRLYRRLNSIPNIKMDRNIYTADNHNKRFISINIKTADFRVIKSVCKSLFPGEWIDYISSKTDLEFIHNCESFREGIFNLLKTPKKIQMLKLAYIADLIEFLSQQDYYSYMKKVMCINNEVVFEIIEESESELNSTVDLVSFDEPNVFVNIDIDEYTNVIFELAVNDWAIFDKVNQNKPRPINYYCPEFPIKRLRENIHSYRSNFFDVQYFKLIKLGDRPFYVKELDDGSLDIKSTPNKFALQAIKYYLRQSINDNDLKFNDEGYPAKYEKPLFIGLRPSNDLQ